MSSAGVRGGLLVSGPDSGKRVHSTSYTFLLSALMLSPYIFTNKKVNILTKGRIQSKKNINFVDFSTSGGGRVQTEVVFPHFF